ncbi:MAG: cytidine/deoxycytidylate deaminase family protein [Candidatus Micrarchaeota archaeon]
MDDPRISWDEYFLNIAKEIARRATCESGKIGAVIVKNKKIISTGYNGAPRGLPHCHDVGCLMMETTYGDGVQKKRCLRTIHSELNAIIQAAMHGVSTDGATLYGLYKPCSQCMKAIINAGIKRVVCLNNYEDVYTDELAKVAGIELVIFNKDKMKNQE